MQRMTCASETLLTSCSESGTKSSYPARAPLCLPLCLVRRSGVPATAEPRPGDDITPADPCLSLSAKRTECGGGWRLEEATVPLMPPPCFLPPSTLSASPAARASSLWRVADNGRLDGWPPNGVFFVVSPDEATITLEGLDAVRVRDDSGRRGALDDGLDDDDDNDADDELFLVSSTFCGDV
jgi:hypothetical protein